MNVALTDEGEVDATLRAVLVDVLGLAEERVRSFRGLAEAGRAAASTLVRKLRSR